MMWLSGRKLASRVRGLGWNPVSYTFHFCNFSGVAKGGGRGGPPRAPRVRGGILRG